MASKSVREKRGTRASFRKEKPPAALLLPYLLSPNADGRNERKKRERSGASLLGLAAVAASRRIGGLHADRLGEADCAKHVKGLDLDVDDISLNGRLGGDYMQRKTRKKLGLGCFRIDEC